MYIMLNKIIILDKWCCKVDNITLSSLSDITSLFYINIAPHILIIHFRYLIDKVYIRVYKCFGSL